MLCHRRATMRDPVGWVEAKRVLSLRVLPKPIVFPRAHQMMVSRQKARSKTRFFCSPHPPQISTPIHPLAGSTPFALGKLTNLQGDPHTSLKYRGNHRLASFPKKRRLFLASNCSIEISRVSLVGFELEKWSLICSLGSTH